MSLASYHCSTPGYCLLSRKRLLSCRGRGRLGLAARVPLEHSRRSELAQLVPDHVLGHEQLHEVLAVVHHERVTDEIGHNRAIARPRLDRLATAGTLLLLDLGEQPLIHVRAFFQRTS